MANQLEFEAQRGDAIKTKKKKYEIDLWNVTDLIKFQASNCNILIEQVYLGMWELCYN